MDLKENIVAKELVVFLDLYYKSEECSCMFKFFRMVLLRGLFFNDILADGNFRININTRKKMIFI